jgi:UDP-N-acetylmuramoyl-tripeptide--D-alanyl-D-alanine ligase
MVKIKVDFLNNIKGLKKIIGNRENIFSLFGYDSRLTEKGELFFAFKTDKNDGNNYIKNALKNGAMGYIGQIEIENLKPEKTGIIVENTFEFLYEITKKFMAASSARIIALTGSAGKTTTKEFLYEILKNKGEVFKTPKNFNSDIGVPLSILSCFKDDTEIAIFELGANRFGEISKNSLLVKPDIAAILNVLNTHLEKLNNLEGVLKAKLEIFDGLKPGGLAVLNYDNDYTRKAGDRFKNKIFFGQDSNSDIIFEIIKQDISGSIIKLDYKGMGREFKTNLFLSTHIKNFAAASSLSIAYGCDFNDIEKSLKNIKPQKHRGKIIKFKDSFILDDSYNSNPDALKLLLGDFNRIDGDKTIVLGEIFELGDKSKENHLGLAEIIKKYKFDKVYFIKGDMIYPFEELKKDLYYQDKVFFYDSASEFKERFFSFVGEKTNIMIKGSHGTELYKLVEELENV